MAIQGSIFIDVDDVTDRDSLDLLTKVLEAMASRLLQVGASDIFIEYAGEPGARRTFGHAEQMTRARLRAGDGAFFAQINLRHLDDPMSRLLPE